MKAWLIDSGLGAGFCSRLFALFFLSAAAACGADVLVVDDCRFGACLPEDAGTAPPETGNIAADAGAPHAETGVDAPIASPQRSPLCAVSGCFPGGQACGEIPLVDGGGDETSSLQRGADSGEEGEESDDVAAPPTEGGVAAFDASSVATDAAVISIDVSLDRAAPDEASFDDSTSVPKACYVFPSASGVSAACAPAGRGAAGSACRDSSDCASTLACVEIDGGGVCRPFSCALPPNCLPGTFYQQAPLIAGGVPLPQTTIPVCSPNVPCSLLEVPTTCTGGKVCAVVGQGETSCMTPGPSKQNEWCDESTGCGEGLVCALRPDKTQNKCLKLCHIDMGVAECPGGTCQGGNNAIPDGFGICVGDTGDGG